MTSPLLPGQVSVKRGSLPEGFIVQKADNVGHAFHIMFGELSKARRQRSTASDNDELDSEETDAN